MMIALDANVPVFSNTVMKPSDTSVNFSKESGCDALSFGLIISSIHLKHRSMSVKSLFVTRLKKALWMLTLCILILPAYTKAQPPCDPTLWVGSTASSNGCNNVIPNSNQFINVGNSGTARIPANLACNNTYYWTNFLYNGTLCVPNNNFAVEVRVRNAAGAGNGIADYDTQLDVFGVTATGPLNSGMRLLQTGFRQQFTGVWAGNVQITNQPNLLQNVNAWGIMRIQFVNNTAQFLFNGVLLQQIAYTGNICSISGLNMNFKGSGDFDWIRVVDGANAELWREDFTTNCSTPFPNLCTTVDTTLNTSFTVPTCADNNLSLLATPALGQTFTYSWTGPNGFTSNQQNPVIANPTTAANGTYTVTATANNCMQTRVVRSMVVNFTVPAIPDIKGPDTVCVGVASQFTNAQPLGVWSSSNIAIATVSNTGLVTGVAPGTADIIYTYGSCVKRKTIRVVVCYNEICTDKCYWRVTGNNIASADGLKNNIFGTLTRDNVRIKTNNEDRGVLTSDGRFGWNTGYPSYPDAENPSTLFHINCDMVGIKTDAPSAIRFQDLQSNNEGYLLLINKEGYVFRSRTYIISQLRELEDKVELLTNKLNSLEQKGAPGVIRNYVKQNVPNPFSKTTRIEYFVEDYRTDAYLLITDMNGKQLQKINIARKGRGVLDFNNTGYSAGMYMYTLVVDDEVVDSRKMIVGTP
jgi:hypothetical protein